MTRRRQVAPANSVEKRSVLYSGSTFVRTRRPFNTWVSWNGHLGDGPVLTIRQGDLRVSAPRGDLLESRDLSVRPSDSVMRKARVGWAGTPFGRRDCIRVEGRDQHGRRLELALSPGDGLQRAWEALLAAGVNSVRDSVLVETDNPPPA